MSWMGKEGNRSTVISSYQESLIEKYDRDHVICIRYSVAALIFVMLGIIASIILAVLNMFNLRDLLTTLALYIGGVSLFWVVICSLIDCDMNKLRAKFDNNERGGD